jgi:hypothetical protein
MSAWLESAQSDVSDIGHASLDGVGIFSHSRRVVLVATLGLCATLLPATIAYADDHDADHIRLMGGHCTTTFAFTGATTVDLQGTCRLRNLGVTTVAASQTATPLDNGTLFVTNTTVYTAASGAQLYANFVGIGVLTTGGISFSGTETYRGGTGRFDDALGSVAISGSAQFTSPTAGVGEFTALGTISF